jgi:hypothetical protein
MGSFEDQWTKCMSPDAPITTHVAADGSKYFFDDFLAGEINQDWWYLANEVKSASPLNVDTVDCTPIYPEGVVLPPDRKTSGQRCVRIKGQGMKHVQDASTANGGPLGYFPPGPHKAAEYGTGGLLVTKSYYASGSYEVGMMPFPKHGMATCMWTYAIYSNSVCNGVTPDPTEEPFCPNNYSKNSSNFGCWYNTDPQNPTYMPDSCQGNAFNGIGSLLNQEIDIETPTYAWREASGDGNCSNVNWKNAKFNTYSLNDHIPDNNFTALRDKNGIYNEYDLKDGRFHVYRFDWNTTLKPIPTSEKWGDEAAATKAGFVSQDYNGNYVVMATDDTAPYYVMLNYQGYTCQYDSDKGLWMVHQGKSIDFYIDGIYQMTYDNRTRSLGKAFQQSFTTRDGQKVTNPEKFPLIPWLSSRLWIGIWPAWFSYPICAPKEVNATQSFDESEMYIDYVKITPFHNDGDVTNSKEATITTWAEDHTCRTNCGYPGMADWQGGRVGSTRIIDTSLCTVARRPSNLITPRVKAGGDECDVASKPLGCSCSSNSSCTEGCCKGNICATKNECQPSACSVSTNKPLNCICTSSGDCSSGCCNNGLCAASSNCKAPSCDVTSNKPLGCACGHKWDCQSSCCIGSPPTCSASSKC